MRRLPHILLVTAVTGCSILDVPPPTSSTSTDPNALSRQMSASIDNVAWFAQIVAIEQSDSTIKFTGVLNVGQTSERSVIIQLRKGITGTQTFGNASGTFAQVGVGNSNITTWTTRAGGPTGTVNVSVLAANHYVGSFNFEALRTSSDLTPEKRTVTNGVFNITF